jgi:hypothetical protein
LAENGRRCVSTADKRVRAAQTLIGMLASSREPQGRKLVRTKTILVATLFALVVSTTVVWAKSFPSGGITRDEMATYLKGKGYPVTEAFESGNKHNILKTTIDGVNIDIYFLDCVTDDTGRCASVQFAASWTVSSPDLEKVNAWNREKRFMRAYLTQSQKSLWAEYDMFLAPNGSTELLDKNLSMVKVLYKRLKEHFSF